MTPFLLSSVGERRSFGYFFPEPNHNATQARQSSNRTGSIPDFAAPSGRYPPQAS